MERLEIVRKPDSSRASLEALVETGFLNLEILHPGGKAKPAGVISTFALTLVPEFERGIQLAAETLEPGGRVVILDLKLTDQLALTFGSAPRADGAFS